MGKQFEKQLSRRIMTDEGWFFFAEFVVSLNRKPSFTGPIKPSGVLIPNVNYITPEGNQMMMGKWITLNSTPSKKMILWKHKRCWKDWDIDLIPKNLSINNL